MYKNLNKLKKFAYNKGISRAEEINIKDIIISEKVREACIANKCGKYGQNLMCPPYVGEIDDFRKELKEFRVGILFLITDTINNPENINEFYESAIKLHKIMLEIEAKSTELGYKKKKTLIGGNCKLCSPCNAELGKKRCEYPDKARPSLEAVGISVINTCKTKGIDIKFKKDEVTWVGLLML